jgi:hypothetical protein
MRRSCVRSLVLFALFLPCSAGCSIGPSSIELPTDHPASPEAPSGFVADVPDVLTPRPDAPRAAQRHADVASPIGAEEPAPPTRSAEAAHQGASESRETSTPRGDSGTGSVVAGSDGPSAVAQQDVDDLFTAYLALSAELARDDDSKARERLSTVREAARRIEVAGEPDKSTRAARVAAAVPKRIGTLADVRADFKAVSAAVIELLATTRPAPNVAATIRRARCPMANASWLQIEASVSNPYYGSEMLRCGAIEETIDLRGER